MTTLATTLGEQGRGLPALSRALESGTKLSPTPASQSHMRSLRPLIVVNQGRQTISGALVDRPIDTRFGSCNSHYVKCSVRDSHRQGTGDRTRHHVQVACAEEPPNGCARTDVGSDGGTNLHGVDVFRGGQVGQAMPHRFAGAAPRAPVSPRPAIRRPAATHPSILPTAGDREADFPAYEPSQPPSPLANPVLPSRSG